MRAEQSPNLSGLGIAIRERRKSLNLTQEQLAQRLGWSQERVSTLENGKYGMPSLPLLAHLAQALELPLSALMESVGFDVGRGAGYGRAPEDPRDTGTGVQAALYYTGQRLLGLQALTLQDAMDQASDLMAEAMGAEKVDVFLYQPEIESLVALGTSNTEMGRKQREAGLDRVPIANRGRQVQVFQTGEAFYTGHADQDPAVVRGLVDTLGVRSLCAVPLRVDGSMRGILVAQSSFPDRFSQAEQDLFEAASHWVGTVAHRAELHEELARRTAEETRRLVAEEMLTMVAHDLGNRIVPIKGQIDLLLRRLERQGWQEDGRAKLALGETSAALGRLSQMVADLLDASRLEGGIFSVARRPVDLVEIVHEVVETARSERPEVEARAPRELIVEADPARVRQVLENLVRNALQHTPLRVPVLVSVGRRQQRDGEWAVVEVHDEGPGIAPDLLPRLFTRHAVGGEGAGLGLGLFLAWGIATAHGGHLSVESEVGRGTTFRLSLPLRPAESAPG